MSDRIDHAEDIHDAIGQRALRQLPDIAAALGIKAVDHE